MDSAKTTFFVSKMPSVETRIAAPSQTQRFHSLRTCQSDTSQDLHSLVEWFFKCSLADGEIQSFDGVSIIEWAENNQIRYLKEFGCKINHYDPYETGDF